MPQSTPEGAIDMAQEFSCRALPYHALACQIWSPGDSASTRLSGLLRVIGCLILTASSPSPRASSRAEPFFRRSEGSCVERLGGAREIPRPAGESAGPRDDASAEAGPLVPALEYLNARFALRVIGLDCIAPHKASVGANFVCDAYHFVICSSITAEPIQDVGA